ncbi:MAG: hypothetical protein R3324_10840, partial [Halobacteriales archaeon]|nr:hypothetical protein [Halobacteriales archaeon]
TASGSSTGSFQVADGGILAIGSGTLTSGATVSGNGNVTFFDRAGPAEIQGSVNVDSLSLTTDSVQAVFSGSYSVNATLVTATGGSLTLSTADSAFSADVALGGGTLDGTAPLVVSDTLTWFAGTLAGSGSLVVASTGYAGLAGSTTKASAKPMLVDGILDILDGGIFDQDADFILDTGGFVRGDGTFDLAGAQSVSWFGDVSPGTSLGLLDVIAPGGGLDLAVASMAFIDLGGPDQGTGFDVLDFIGDVTLNSDLVVDTMSGFSPQVGDTLPVITVAGIRTGAFNSVSLPTLTDVQLDTAWASGASADTLFIVANSAPSGSIAFYSDRPGDSEIYVMNGDGSLQTRLTDNAARDENPALSPDGSRIAFLSNRNGLFELWAIDSDGLNESQLTSGESAEGSWSPDGTQIVYPSRADGGNFWDIWIVNADGTNPTQITFNDWDEIDPFWSPDGTTIGFSSNQDGDFDLYVMRTDGTDVQQRTFSFDVNDLDAEWSPDGSRIVFRRQAADGEIVL